jgi:hypothetical protein
MSAIASQVEIAEAVVGEFVAESLNDAPGE